MIYYHKKYHNNILIYTEKLKNKIHKYQNKDNFVFKITFKLKWNLMISNFKKEYLEIKKQNKY